MVVVQREELQEKPFLMSIEDVFSIPGKGTVVTSRIERGVIKPGEEIEIVGIRETARTRCIGVEILGKALDQGQAGQNVGLVLEGVEREELERGQVLARPGSIAPHTIFGALLHFHPAESSGHDKPFLDGDQLKFGFHGEDFVGTLEFPGDIKVVVPGDEVELEVQLTFPIAMEEGLKFWVGTSNYLGVGSLGTGVVTRIIV